MVRKNTFPYIYQWSIIDIANNYIIEGYATRQEAQMACGYCNKYYESHPIDNKPQFKDILEMLIVRMKKPDGDSIPNDIKYYNKRRIIINND
ncbi:MAG: hypothetical protein JSW11_00340 [Candidatus Heimdallarchaeota archaeon]|nr:MAG: hypothetical protein JSW11_00340 [Candidatus Heimdallarchaeota archaeon]